MQSICKQKFTKHIMGFLDSISYIRSSSNFDEKEERADPLHEHHFLPESLLLQLSALGKLGWVGKEH